MLYLLNDVFHHWLVFSCDTCDISSLDKRKETNVVDPITTALQPAAFSAIQETFASQPEKEKEKVTKAQLFELDYS